MYFHGIPFPFLLKQYPLLFPDAHVSAKKNNQLKDRIHLIEQFGLEPIHLLQSSANYSVRTCLEECFSFGDVVLCYPYVKPPYWQMSEHEIGVQFLDVREAQYIFIQLVRKKLKDDLVEALPALERKIRAVKL